jgi:hypothetical protein
MWLSEGMPACVAGYTVPAFAARPARRAGVRR